MREEALGRPWPQQTKLCFSFFRYYPIQKQPDQLDFHSLNRIIQQNSLRKIEVTSSASGGRWEIPHFINRDCLRPVSVTNKKGYDTQMIREHKVFPFIECIILTTKLAAYCSFCFLIGKTKRTFDNKLNFPIPNFHFFHRFSFSQRTQQ